MEASAKKNVTDAATVPAIASQGESSAVIIRTEDIATLNTLMKVSVELHQSGMFPHLSNRGQYLAVILAGNARGLDPMTALMNIHIVNGRLGFSGQMIAGELRKAGVRYQVLSTTIRSCKIKFTRPGDEEFTYEFTEDDAKRAGKLPGKDNSVWKSYPQDMLYWRCLTAGARRYAPDAIMGMYLKDEVDEIPFEDATPEDERPKAVKETLRAKADKVRQQTDQAPETAAEEAPEAAEEESAENATEEAQPEENAAEEPSGEAEAPEFDRKGMIAEIGKLEGQKDCKVKDLREECLNGILDLNNPVLGSVELTCYLNHLRTLPDKKKSNAKPGEEF